jgi:enoyl-CoA hydratase/carnithine racemase
MDMAADLQRQVESASADPTIRVIVLTGAGEASFISGADIREFRSSRADIDSSLRAYGVIEGLCHSLESARCPAIAMLNGSAVGAGCEVAIACDLRVAAQGVRMGIPAARLGISLGRPHLERLVQLVGPARTRDLLYTARLVSDQEALRMGLVDRVVEGVRLKAETEALAAQIAELAPLSVAYSKRTIGTILRGDPPQPESDAMEAVHSYQTRDFWEGVSAFEEKRKPRFSGE